MTHELQKKYRPSLLKKVIGQPAAVNTIKTWLAKDKIPHAIIFTGPSGCGKTTLARILASKLEVSSSDFVEINAAKSRGIDDIRSIDRRMGSSAIGGKSRVWLIDECHQLTSQAQESVLKMLEDPPQHVYFMLATTSPGKVIRTIHTRCSKVAVKSMSAKDLLQLINETADAEGKSVPEDVADRIVEISDGSAREALVYLDQVIDVDGEQEQLNILIASDTKRQAFDICRLLMDTRTKWGVMASLLKDIEVGDDEGIRRMVLGYANKVLLSGKGDKVGRAYVVINAFRDNWFDCGRAGLLSSCYEVVSGQ